MTVSSDDMVFRKSVIQTDTPGNGGRKGSTQVMSGVRHALFPRVTAASLTAGLTRVRKEFLCNENESDESAEGVMVHLMRPSNAEDRFYIAKGTQTDIFSEFDRATYPYARTWMGAGQLNDAVGAGSGEVSLAMEDSDYQFPQGGYLYLSDNTMVSQTIDADVKIGDSVYFSGGTWSKVTHTDNITYPYGWCAAADEVLTKQTTTNEEYLEIATNQYSGESIATGDGSDTNPALSTLTNVTNGICRQAGFLPTVTATCGSSERTVAVSEDGVCSGYCSAGELNMATGAWTTDITWSTAPDNLSDVEIEYYENCFSYSGNVATVELEDQTANAYTTVGTYGAGCINEEEVACAVDSWVETSSAGTFDETTYPLTMYNDGTVEDVFTLTFSDSANYSVSGTYYGSVGSGATGTDFSPTNADTGQPYFTLASAGFAGTWASGDTIVFHTSPAGVPILIEELVPAGTTQEPNNMLPIGSYIE